MVTAVVAALAIAGFPRHFLAGTIFKTAGANRLTARQPVFAARAVADVVAVLAITVTLRQLDALTWRQTTGALRIRLALGVLAVRAVALVVTALTPAVIAVENETVIAEAASASDRFIAGPWEALGARSGKVAAFPIAVFRCDVGAPAARQATTAAGRRAARSSASRG